MAILQGPNINNNESNIIALCRELLQDQRAISLQFAGRGTKKLADSVIAWLRMPRGKLMVFTTYVF